MKKLFKKVVGYAAFALAALVPALSANAVTKTFYYDDSSTNYRNTGSSTGVAVHIWWDGGDVYPDSPIKGTVVEGTDGKIYKFVIEDNNYNRFIFKRTDSWDGQSKDLTTTIEDKALYKADGTNQTVYISQSNYSEPSEPKVSWFLQGDGPMMSWSNDKTRELKYNESTNCYELTYTIPASTDFQFVYNLGNKDTRYRTKGNNNDGSNDEVELGADEQLYAVSYSMYTLTEMTDVKIQIYKDGSNWKVRFGASPTTDIKVICKNTAKWDNVKISYWGDGQNAKTYDMKKSSGDLWEYTISETWTPTGFTFSDGNGNKYKYNQAPVNGNTYTNGEYVEPEPGKGIRVRLKDEANWGSVKIHYWEKNSSGKLLHETTWPGVDMTKVGSYFEYTITDDWTPTGFMFVKGSDSNTKVSSENAGPVDGKIYTNKNSNLSEYSVPMPSSMTLYYTTDHNNDNAQWGYQGMTKEGNKFVCTVKKVEKSKDFHFHFVSNTDDTYVCNSSNNENLYTDGNGRELKYQIKNSDNKSYDFKYYFGDSEADLIFEIDFENEVVIVTRDGYVAPDYNYYLLGDVNNWMNDGTYTTNGKEYGYGYSKAENGVRADYQFVPTTINGSNKWYVLDLANTATNGRLWGQFTIVQDKGCFKAAEKEENKHDGRDVINWNGSYAQWANQYNRETATDSYKAETLKTYKSVAAAIADLNNVSQAVKGNRSNFHLDHNLYKNVKIYFNPTDQKIFMTYEVKPEDPKNPEDFYIYLSTTADRAENGDRKVNVIKESMNNDNYTLDFSDLIIVKSQQDGDNVKYVVDVPEGKTEAEIIANGKKMEHKQDEPEKLANGLYFTNYWKIKIPNGLEGPSGQKFVVSIRGAQDENAKAYSSIFLNNLYFIDGVRVFATHSTDVEVAEVAYRIYGLPSDGNPENLQIFAADGTQMAVKDDHDNEFGWVKLQWGKYEFDAISTDWWSDKHPGGLNPDHANTAKDGFLPSYKDEDTKVFHEVPASHASKCIQWKITYGKRASAANEMKKTRTSVQLNPATADLTVDRSDPNADWVLNGRHKELVIGIATGVEDIEMEDGEISEEGEAVAPVYYNLQGVRVAEPQHGLYIKVTGNKSEKILVK